MPAITPRSLCEGRWPTGPFSGASGEAEQKAAELAAHLAGAVRRTRKQRGWSQAQLSVRAAVGPHTVGRIETGRGWPDLITIARLASALDMPMRIDTTDQPEPGPAGPRPQAVGVAVLPDMPMRVDLMPGQVPSPAHAIEAIFAYSPDTRAQVERIARMRTIRDGRPS